MVRTKADAYTKAASKAPRKQHILRGGNSPAASKNGKVNKYAGGNPYCPRPTPSWQKPITSFFAKCDEQEENMPPEASACASETSQLPTEENQMIAVDDQQPCCSGYRPEPGPSGSNDVKDFSSDDDS
ncbi:PCNA-associated factor, partial [Stegodyphus mimosarum]